MSPEINEPPTFLSGVSIYYYYSFTNCFTIRPCGAEITMRYTDRDNPDTSMIVSAETPFKEEDKTRLPVISKSVISSNGMPLGLLSITCEVAGFG